MANQALTGFRRVQSVFGDTLQALAARELNDATRWPEIAAINNLAPPYLTGDPELAGPRVARFGDTLIVPATAPDIVPGATTAADVFKRDVALPKGRLTAANGDLVTVAGRENLRQAITHRIMTTPGELLFHLDYGCAVSKLKGRGSNAVNSLLGAKFVQAALQRDGRIAQVVSAVATVTGDTVAIDAVVQTVSGHPVDASVSV